VVLLVVVALAGVLSVVSLVVRFRRSRGEEGVQLKWSRTVEGFSARLRDQVELDALSAELLAVVDQTVQPTRASLWLRS
jgi:hypothetical protein